jgi:hypothetical protein
MVTIVWISNGNWIYWTLTHNSSLQVTVALLLIHALQFTAAHTYVFSVCCVFTSCLVTASNSGHSASYGFPNCPRASATSLSQQQPTGTETQQSATNSLTPLHYIQDKVKVMLRLMASRPVLVLSPIWDQTPDFCHCQRVVGLLKWGALLLVIDNAVVLGPKTHGTHDNILLSQIWHSPKLKGQVLVYLYPQETVAQVLGSLLFASKNSQGYGGDIWTLLPNSSCL